MTINEVEMFDDNPSPEDVKKVRESIQGALGFGITAAQDYCAFLVKTSRRSWQQWEREERNMHPAFWELANIKVKKILENGEMMHQFDTGTANLNEAKVIHDWKEGLNHYHICIAQTENGNVAYITDNRGGDPVEMRGGPEEGSEDLKEWLDGSGLSRNDFLELVTDYELWD